MEASFLRLLIARVKSKSPRFYIVLRYLAMFLAVLCGTAVAVLNSGWIQVDPALVTKVGTVCGEVAKGCSMLFGFSFLGTTDNELNNAGNKQ